MSTRRPLIFHFARWYPHRYDPMFGLFVQRHVESLTEHTRSAVLYVHGLEGHKGRKSFEVDMVNEKGVTVARAYYNKVYLGWRPLTALYSVFRYYLALVKGYKMLRRELGTPDIIHVHILTRMGLAALWLKWRHGIPFVITEHWSRYQQTGNFSRGMHRWLTRLVVRNASCVTTVTDHLGRAMRDRHRLAARCYRVLPNVVDPVFFQSQPQPKKARAKDELHLVHVSCFEDRSKNVSGLLRVVKLMHDKGMKLHVTLVGDGMDHARMVQFAAELGVSDWVTFTGVLQGADLVKAMSAADALWVNSHYENLPVVIPESLTLGVPVISTRVGGISEILQPEDGILVDPGDDMAMVKAIEKFAGDQGKFSDTSIGRQVRATHSPEGVCKMLMSIYEQALKEKQ